MLFEANAARASIGIAVVRIAAGLIFFMHGWQKFFDNGIAGVAGFFGSIGIPLPGVAAPFVATLETVGGALLVLGLFSRPLAALLAVDMLVATLLVHLPNGFYIGNGGIEFTGLLMVICVMIVLAGGGRPAVDEVLAGRKAPAAP